MSYYSKANTPSIVEKLLAIISYLFPLFGFAVIILSVLMKKDLKIFLKYHVYQAIFIQFAFWLIYTGLTFILNLVSYIPIVKNIVSMITFLLNTPLFFHFSIVTFGYFLFLLYLIIGVLRGSNSFVPWVSNIIKANLKGQM